MNFHTSALKCLFATAATLWIASAAGAPVSASFPTDSPALSQLAPRINAGLQALGHLPTHDRIVVERCFDDSEGSQLIIHAPFGGRVNRALGLALRKRFCVSFDFELQAAATDDAIVLSLGTAHSFPLTDAFHFVRPEQLDDTLRQAVLQAPLFGARWRWNVGLPQASLRKTSALSGNGLPKSLSACSRTAEVPCPRPVLRRLLRR